MRDLLNRSRDYIPNNLACEGEYRSDHKFRERVLPEDGFKELT